MISPIRGKSAFLIFFDKKGEKVLKNVEPCYIIGPLNCFAIGKRPFLLRLFFSRADFYSVQIPDPDAESSLPIWNC